MTNDATRRAEFLAYFDKHIKRRETLINSGITKGRVTQYFDESEPFGERAAINLEKRLGLETGEMFPSLRTSLDPVAIPASTAGSIPVVGTAQLGDNGHFHELEHPVGHGDGCITWPTRDPNAYALRCKGESMKPRIRHNEYVIVEPNHQVFPGDEVLVKSLDGRVMVKQLAYIRDGMIHLDSVNESHPRVSILTTEVAVLHYVAGIAKSSLWSDDEV